jgi:antitoxin HicB
MNDLKDYMSLPYRIELIPDEGGIVARIPDLPGCISSGDTSAEALEGLEEAKALWISARLDAGHSVPTPFTEDNSYSGKFVVRIPKSLHRSLDERARAERMSLNSYVLYLLTERHTEHFASRRRETVMDVAQLCWDEPKALHGDAAMLASMCRKALTGYVKGFDLDEAVVNIGYAPRPPQAAHILLGTTKQLKKKEFSS